MISRSVTTGRTRSPRRYSVWRDGHNGFWHEICVLVGCPQGSPYICLKQIQEDVEVNLKRDLHGPLLRNGKSCWRNGREGRLEGTLCVIASVVSRPTTSLIIAQADVQNHPKDLLGPRRPEGQQCWKDGRAGVLRGALCVFVRTPKVPVLSLADIVSGRFQTGLASPRKRCDR